MHHACAIVHGANRLACQHQAAAIIRQRAAAGNDAQRARFAGAAQQQAVGRVERLVADVFAPCILPGRDHRNALASSAHVGQRCFHLAARHQLPVDAGGLDMPVAKLGSSGQLRRSVIPRGIGHHGIAQDGRARGWHKLPVGRRALEVHLQRVAQLQRLHNGLVLSIVVNKSATHGTHFGDADVLGSFTDLALVLHQHQRFADGRAGVAVFRVHEDLDRAHALDVVFEQKARPGGAGKQPGFHAPGRIGAAREVATISKQHHAHAGVFGLGGSNVQAHQRIGVIGLHRHGHLPQRHIAEQPIGVAHVDKDVVAGTVFDHLGRWPAAALGHIGHHLAFE